MSVKEFDKDDKEYLDWMDKNRNCLVVNTLRNLNRKFFILHKANCLHITSTTGYPEGIFTQREKIKVGANDLNELKKWFSENRKKFEGRFIECRTCNPISDTPIKE